MFEKLIICRDVRKIHPAPHIDERDYTENVTRRNSRTESMNGINEIGRNSRLRSSSRFILGRPECNGLAVVDI